MNSQYNRRITVLQTLIFIFMVGSFTAVWCLYYNNYMFVTMQRSGAIIAIVVFTIMYGALGKIYRAFEIGVYQIGETAFSQIISVFFADLVMYLQCCLVFRQYVDIRPGLLTFAVQIVGAVIWAYGSKSYYIKHVSPSDTIIIRGKDELYSILLNKLSRTYTHLFSIKEQITEEQYLADAQNKLSNYSSIILYEVSENTRAEILKYCISEDKKIFLTPSIEDLMFKGFETRHYVDTPLLCYTGNKMVEEEPAWKRILDITLSSIALLITSPIMLIVAIAIKIEDGGPVFFKQARCTKNGRVFQMIKFRSMIVAAEKDGEVIPFKVGDSRVTKCGKFIRRYRLDELPQFINILKGDMSVVGPRPERVEHVEQYTKEMKEFSYRLAVKGGLTGYAQVYGKYNTSPEDKLKLDLMYIQNQSLVRDLKIILLTIKTIIYSNGTDGFEEKKLESYDVKRKKAAKNKNR